MAYASASNVAALCQNLLGGASIFDSSSSPTITSVNAWLDEGSSAIDLYLNSAGYTVPVVSTAALYLRLRSLNMLYGAAFAELSRINVTLAPGERTRGQVFLQMFNDGLEELSSMGLWGIGALGDTTLGQIYVGGISIADKESIESNSDRVPQRFNRSMLRFSGAGNPSKVSVNS